MSWDWTRTVRGLALAAWGGFFVYLWVSGRATTYIGPKTTWVVTLGAITLPIVALAYLWGARGTRRAPSVREVGANGAAGRADPARADGSRAVAGRAGGQEQADKNPPAPVDAPIEGEIRLYEIAWAASPRSTRR